MLPHDDLTATFWRLIPERAASITELWLSYEQADPAAMRDLKRLLHTMKGEAHMLQLTRVAQLLEATEGVVGTLPERADPTVNDAAAALFESVELLAVEMGSPESGGSAALEAQTQRLHALANARSRMVAEPSAPPETRTTVSIEPPRAAANDMAQVPALDTGRVQPLVTELRRLLEERAGAALKLREAHRMLRAVLAEFDPTLPPLVLAERAVKTVGYGWEVERRLTEVRALWSAGEFAFEQSLESLEDVVRAASMVQIASLAPRMVRLVRSTAAALDKEVDFELRGDAAVGPAVARRLETALVHMVRNAVDHGIEPLERRLAAGKSPRGSITIHVSGEAGRVEVAIVDDGGGVDLAALRERLGAEADAMNDAQVLQSIFRHGVSTRTVATDISGRGVGLDVVFEEMQLVGGAVEVETQPGHGTRFVLRMPATTRVDVIVPFRVGAILCGLPSHHVVRMERLGDVVSSASRPRTRVTLHGGTALVPVVSLHHVLGETEPERAGQLMAVIVHRSEAFAVLIDAYDSPRPMALQEPAELAFESPLVAAVAPTPDGHVLLVLDPAQVLAEAARGSAAQQAEQAPSGTIKHVVVAEDAPVARELLCGILRSFGLRVSEAADGRQALALALRHKPDLVMTDLEMPFMGGLELIGELRRDPSLRSVPVIVLTTRDDPQTRERVRALGVSGFLTKQRFVEAQLRELVDACLVTV